MLFRSHGGLNREGFLTADVETPFSVAETLDTLPSGLNATKSPRHVTTVCDGLVDVEQPRRPADVGARLVGMS